MSWLESKALVNILGGGNLYSGCVSGRSNVFRRAEHVRQAVNTLARYGDLLKVRGEERHDARARLFFSFSEQARSVARRSMRRSRFL